MNDCLAGIKQRLENEAKLEETRHKVEAERCSSGTQPRYMLPPKPSVNDWKPKRPAKHCA